MKPNDFLQGEDKGIYIAGYPAKLVLTVENGEVEVADWVRVCKEGCVHLNIGEIIEAVDEHHAKHPPF